MNFFAADCPAKRMGDPEECAALALFLASGLARYITGATIPVDSALSAGHQSISSWKHPEILTGGKLNSQSTIAALMENEAAKPSWSSTCPVLPTTSRQKLPTA